MRIRHVSWHSPRAENVSTWEAIKVVVDIGVDPGVEFPEAINGVIFEIVDVKLPDLSLSAILCL